MRRRFFKYDILGLKKRLLYCSGASSDFDGATKIAKMMVTRFGMSDKVNNDCKVVWSYLLLTHHVEYENQNASFQLGVMTYTDVTKQSPETQAAIEQEVRLLLKVNRHKLSLYHLPVIGQPPPTSSCRTPIIVLRTSWRLTARNTRY